MLRGAVISARTYEPRARIYKVRCLWIRVVCCADKIWCGIYATTGFAFITDVVLPISYIESK